MSLGSLFSGVDGLGLGLERAGLGPVAWQVESDPHASTVLAQRFPGVPNHGDVTAVDWSKVEPVEGLVGGPPCQPASSAGKRLGVSDERWMWPEALRAVRDLRPRWCLFENPPGIFAVGGGEPFGWILASLAEAGYVGQWWCVRASDIGAPHRRERVLIVAQDARCGERPAAWAGEAGWPHSLGPAGEPSRPGGGAPADTHDGAEYGERSRAQPWKRGADAPHADWSGPQGTEPAGRRNLSTGSHWDSWGPYGTAIRRWEVIHGPAPEPVDVRGRLNPRFSEWMMGFPPGWVTDCNIPVSAMHRCIGNAVVVQVSEVVGRQLLAWIPQLETANVEVELA